MKVRIDNWGEFKVKVDNLGLNYKYKLTIWAKAKVKVDNFGLIEAKS